MKLLVDKCMASAVTRRLRDEGHDVSAVAEWDRDPGDLQILERAARERRVLVTIDSDFGALIFRDQATRIGVLRLREQPPQRQAERASTLIAAHKDQLEAGAFVTDDGERARVTPRRD